MNPALKESLAAVVEPQRTGSLEAPATSPALDNSTGPLALPLQVVERRHRPTKPPQRQFNIWLLLAVAAAAMPLWFARDRIADGLPINRPQPLADVAMPAMKKVVALGRLEPEGEVIEVAGPSGSGDARVQSVAVNVGDRVEAGQVLAVLDNNEQLQTQQAVAQAQVEQARMRLQQSRLIASTTYAQLRASLEALRSQRETARSDLRRQAQLRKSNASSEQEYETTLLAFATSDKAVAEAEAKLARYAEDAEDSVDVQLAQTDV